MLLTKIFVLWMISFFSLVETRNFREVMNMVLERFVVTHCNEKYVSNCLGSVSRKSRKDNYVLNFGFYIKRPLMDNVTFKFISHMLLSNVYKESVIRIDEPVCIAIKNPFLRALGAEFANMVLDKCPISGQLNFSNMTLNVKGLPIDLPNSQQRFDMGIYQNEENQVMAASEIYAKIEHKIVRLAKRRRKKLKSQNNTNY